MQYFCLSVGLSMQLIAGIYLLVSKLLLRHATSVQGMVSVFVLYYSFLLLLHIKQECVV